MWKRALATIVASVLACEGSATQTEVTPTEATRTSPVAKTLSPAAEPDALSPADRIRLERQRDHLGEVAHRTLGVRLTRTSADLPALQRLVDSGVLARDDLFALEALAVAFGDAISGELSLRWVMLTNEHGNDPALRGGDGRIVDVLALVAAPLERSEPLDLTAVRETLAETGKR
jgi:hypothetical protein